MEDNPPGRPGRGTGAGRAAGLLAALLVLVAGFALPAFRSSGNLTGLVAVPIALAVATAGVAVFGASAWSLLAALFVVGQGVTLQLVHAGNMVGYQHLMPAGEMVAGDGRPWLVFVIVQAAIVLVVWLRRRPGADHARFRPGWRLFAVIAAAVLAGAALSRDPVLYGVELVSAAAIAAVQLANLALAIALVPAGRIDRLTRAFDRLLGQGAAPRRIDRFVLLAAAWAVLVAGLLSRFVYQAHPHIPDEVTYLMQARYFAAGELTMPAPPVPQAFDLDLMTFEPTRWYSPLTPAWSAVLAIGVKLGAPWLVNPVLTGVVVLLAWLFVAELYDRRTARLTTLLLCVSPWFLWMGANLMNHQWSLACAMIAALGVARARRPGARRWLWLVASGAALGVIAMIRPLEGLCLALLLAAWAFGSAPATGFVRRLAPVAVLAAVSAAVSSVQLAYNQLLTGSATAFPVMRYLHEHYGEGSNALGFGANRGFGWTGLDPLPGHGPVDVVINSMLNTYLIDVELLGWSIGCLLPILVLLAWGRMRRADWLMAITVLGVVVAHAFYWFSGGPDFGARYWYLVLLPCLALAARGIETVGGRLAAGRGDPSGPTRALAAAALLSLAALVTFMPWRAADKYWHYRNMRPDIRSIAKTRDFGGDDLIIIRGNRHPDYASAAVYNPIDLSAARPIYVWEREPDVMDEVLRAYADREVWVIDGPTLTHDGFHVVSGPVPATQMLEGLTRGR